MEGLQDGLAGLFAAPAGLGADAAMLVHLGVPLTFFRAEPAGVFAGGQYTLKNR